MADAFIAPVTTPLGDSRLVARFEALLKSVKRALRYRPYTAHTIKFGKKSQEFSEYRPYLPGDDFRQVDWHVYCRLRELVVRQPGIEIPIRWAIVLDVSASMALYHKLDWARQLAAALAYLGLHLADQVTLLPLPISKPMVYQGHSDLHQALHYLENIHTQPIIPWSLRQTGATLARYTTIFVISDFYAPYRDWLPVFKLKKMRPIFVHPVAEAEYRPTLQGTVLLQDAESQTSCQLRITPTLLAGYQKRLAQHLAQVKNWCHQHQTRYYRPETIGDATLEKAVWTILQLLEILP